MPSAFKAKFVDKIPGKECSDITRDAVKLESKKFKEEMLTKMNHIVANLMVGTYGQMLSEVMFGLLEHGLASEKNVKNGYEYEREDVAELVDFWREQFQNQIKILSGKEKQVEFGTITWQLTNALCSRSKARFREHKALSPCPMPSISTYQKNKAQNRIKDVRAMGGSAYHDFDI